MFKVNSKVQALDKMCSTWRDATIVECKENRYVIHFENFNNKHDSFYEEGKEILIQKKDELVN